MNLLDVLSVRGPGHNITMLKALGFPPNVRQELEWLESHGEVVKWGNRWFRHHREHNRKTVPPPPPMQQVKSALEAAGIQEIEGRIVKRTRRTPKP